MLGVSQETIDKILEHIYYYKGKEYRLVSEVKLKHPTTGEWIDAIQYLQRGNKEMSFVREKEDFIKKFEPYSKRFG